MKKIFVGGPGSCDVHFEKDMIQTFMDTYYTKWELTDDYRNADLIVILDTCVGTYKNLESSINYIEKVLKNKKLDTKVIVSGCLIKGVKFELTSKQKNILEQVICISSDKIVEYVSRIIKPNFEIEFEERGLLEDFSFPYEWARNSISFSIVSGCDNRCTFCKSNYMNFPVKSVPFEKIMTMSNDIKGIDYPFNHMFIHSSNLSLYGVDLYGRQRCHEAVKTLTQPDCVKFVNIGCLINFYPELIREIIENQKIKTIFVSLESGSERIYNSMNRPLSLQKLIEIIKVIRQYRPDIIINTELICGFPTERLDDLKKSIELVYELDLNIVKAWPYTDSLQLPSSKLLQHSFEYNMEASMYVYESLEKQTQKYRNIIENGEMIVIEKDDAMGFYQVLLVDGEIKNISFLQLDRVYNVGDLIPANMIIAKQVMKRRLEKK